MKPTKNRIYCKACNGIRMLFETRRKGENFIRFNADEILKETGYAPVRCYYCKICGGWHVTSNENQEYFKQEEYKDSLDLNQCHLVVNEVINKLREAYKTRDFEVCYKYIEEAYIEMEKAERANIDINLEFTNEISHLNCYANGLHKSCPRYSPKLNLSIKRIDELTKELENNVSVFSDDYTACNEIIKRINSEMTMAVRYGAGVRKLKKGKDICERFSSPQKIKLYLERNELYRQIVQAYRLKDYLECSK